MERGFLRRHAALLSLVAIEGLWSVYLTLTRTLPRGHDGFQYFYLKFYFFNDFVKNGELAQWMPYVSHGSPAAWWYIVQTGMFDLPLFAVARVLRIDSFIPIFYVLLFLEKLLLLIGAWLLVGEHVTSRAARFVATAAIALTTIWYTSPWWNFHAFLALPMMLFLLHRTIRQFQWFWLVGLSLLLFLQTFGQLSYFLPMTLLFLTAYGGLLLSEPESRTLLRERFRLSVAGLFAVVLCNAALLLELVWLRRSSGEIAFPASQRASDGSVPLDMFLTHGGSMDLRPINQFLTGLTPQLDFTVFGGFLIAGLTIITLTAGPLNRSQKLFGWLTLLTVLVGTSSPVAVLLYYFWPLGNLFRHLSLVLPVAKLFCVVMAAITFDRLIKGDAGRTRHRSILAGGIFLGAWVVLLIWFGADATARQGYIRGQVVSAVPPIDDYARLLSPRYVFRGAAFSALSYLSLMVLLSSRERTARVRQIALASAGVLALDALTYHSQELHSRTLSVSPREGSVFTVTELPYADRRDETTDDVMTPRHRTFSKSAGRLIGTRYGAESLLWLTDGYRTSGFAVLWSREFESLLAALRYRPGLARLGTEDSSLPLPVNDALVTSIGGWRDAKIRFFDTAMVCPDAESAAAIIAEPSYRGQVALLTAGSMSLDTGSSGFAVLPCDRRALPAGSTSAAETRPTARNVRFTSNLAEFIVENPTGRPAVMTYSDSAAAYWQARVNDIEVPILRSDLAYKAVVVGPGSSRVVFEYHDRLAETVFALQGLASLMLLVFLGRLP